MLSYIGTKRIHARPMTRGDYNDYRGWQLPADENGRDEGYLVVYQDGGKGNMADQEGYVSWSPKDVFDRSYQPQNAMSFGHAIELLRTGARVCRGGWNGKGMWLELMSDGVSTLPSGDEFTALPFIVMKAADNKIVPWLASQTDVLAEDWMIVDTAA